MGRELATLNTLLVETFNAILKVEEDSLRQVTGSQVTVNEMHILDAVGVGSRRTVSELAAANMVTVSTMTIAVNRLETKGLVAREREPADRRVVKVRLTPRGEMIAVAHQRFHRRMADAVIQGLERDQIAVLTAAMENLMQFFRLESTRNQAAAEFEGLSD